ncbi:AsnC family transcriptional regulator [Rhodobacterales bacterium HKCCE3408]|nr:AsnC family transcriptional regulator [Rhodobacterales bacterium HKCCE3408]
MADIDGYDRTILRLMAADARQTGKELAERVGLSPASCLRRLQRLREIGAIEREVAIIAPRYADRRVKVLSRVQIERTGQDRMDRLRRKFQRLPEVEQFFQVTGEFDVVLLVSFPSMEDYANFCQAHYYDGTVKGYDSMVVLREFPVEAPDQAS